MVPARRKTQAAFLRRAKFEAGSLLSIRVYPASPLIPTLRPHPGGVFSPALRNESAVGGHGVKHGRSEANAHKYGGGGVFPSSSPRRRRASPSWLGCDQLSDYFLEMPP